jgi:hypothetical protein
MGIENRARSNRKMERCIDRSPFVGAMLGKIRRRRIKRSEG